MQGAGVVNGCRDLVLDNLPADSITADQGQAARNKAIENFRSGKTWLLVTTDLLARVRVHALLQAA